jgi:hypothetical protein
VHRGSKGCSAQAEIFKRSVQRRLGIRGRCRWGAERGSLGLTSEDESEELEEVRMGILTGCTPRQEVLKGDLDDAIFRRGV